MCAYDLKNDPRFAKRVALKINANQERAMVLNEPILVRSYYADDDSNYYHPKDGEYLIALGTNQRYAVLVVTLRKMSAIINNNKCIDLTKTPSSYIEPTFYVYWYSSSTCAPEYFQKLSESAIEWVTWADDGDSKKIPFDQLDIVQTACNAIEKLYNDDNPLGGEELIYVNTQGSTIQKRISTIRGTTTV